MMYAGHFRITPAMDRLQEIYPFPPLVLFVSNNEHDRLKWTEVEKSKRYLGKLGRNPPSLRCGLRGSAVS